MFTENISPSFVVGMCIGGIAVFVTIGGIFYVAIYRYLENLDGSSIANGQSKKIHKK
jgi:hypothetical protein